MTLMLKVIIKVKVLRTSPSVVIIASRRLTTPRSYYSINECLSKKKTNDEAKVKSFVGRTQFDLLQ